MYSYGLLSKPMIVVYTLYVIAAGSIFGRAYQNGFLAMTAPSLLRGWVYPTNCDISKYLSFHLTMRHLCR